MQRNTAPSLRLVALDDNPFELESLAHALQTPGRPHAEATFTQTIAAFLAEVARLDPDVVTIDVDLGLDDATGLDVIGAARRLAPRAFICMCSSDASPQTMRDALGLGADDYLVKGTLPDDLGAFFAQARSSRS